MSGTGKTKRKAAYFMVWLGRQNVGKLGAEKHLCQKRRCTGTGCKRRGQEQLTACTSANLIRCYCAQCA